MHEYIETDQHLVNYDSSGSAYNSPTLPLTPYGSSFTEEFDKHRKLGGFGVEKVFMFGEEMQQHSHQHHHQHQQPRQQQQQPQQQQQQQQQHQPQQHQHQQHQNRTIVSENGAICQNLSFSTGTLPDRGGFSSAVADKNHSGIPSRGCSSFARHGDSFALNLTDTATPVPLGQTYYGAYHNTSSNTTTNTTTTNTLNHITMNQQLGFPLQNSQLNHTTKGKMNQVPLSNGFNFVPYYSKNVRRSETINIAFAAVRNCIPNVSKDTKLSKIQTLRLAISYIRYLMGLVGDYRFMMLMSEEDKKRTINESFFHSRQFVPQIRSPNKSTERKNTSKNEKSKSPSPTTKRDRKRQRSRWPQVVWERELET